MNTPNHDYTGLNIAVFKAEADEKFSSISSQIKEVSTLTRELLDQISDLKLGVGILTHSIKIIEADHENQIPKRESQASTIKDIIRQFDGIIDKVNDVDSKLSKLEVYIPLLTEITDQRNQNIARATTLQNSFISSLGGSLGEVVKWVIMILMIAGLSNAGAIITLLTGNNQAPKPESKPEPKNYEPR